MLLRNVLGKTLRDERGAVIGYGISLALYGLFLVTMFPSVGQMPGLTEMMESFPPAMKALMGEISAYSTIEGFLALEVLTWYPLILAIFAIMSATDFVAGEAERGTLDLLLSQPVRRWRLISDHMMALTISLVVITLLSAVGIWVGLPFANASMPPTRIIWATLAAVPLVLVIAAFSLVLGCLFLSRRRAGMVAAGLTVIFYLLNSLSVVVEQLKPWSKLSPFHYFNSYEALATGPDLGNVAILLAAALVLTLVSVVIFQRRDILTA